MQTYPPGTRIGQYEIASRPMIGGMGVVYFALDHGNDGRPVALKTFRPELLPDRAARDRFLREGTAWIELGSHPHIVRCYKVEYIDPTAFLVLELIAKEQNTPDASLRSWLIPGRPLPLDQALLFALQIARGMQHATEKIPGFVHRDLKPENILVGADILPGTNLNRLRVTDFGLVKILQDENVKISDAGGSEDIKRAQLTHGAVGTPLYMAPEQWMSEPVGIFTDVYGFGCLLYEMLTGHHAAEGKTIAELRVAHCDGKPYILAKKMSSSTGDLMIHCLAVDPDNRYRNWNEVEIGIIKIYNNTTGQDAPEKIAEENITLFEQIDSGASYFALGQSYMDISMYDQAVPYFEQTTKIAYSVQENIGSMQEKRLVLPYRNMTNSIIGLGLLSLSMAYIQLHNQEQAKDYLEEYLQFTKHEPTTGDSGKDVLLTLGDINLALNNASRAKEFYEQALIAEQETKDIVYEGEVLYKLGIMWRSTGQPQKARQYFELALIIAMDSKQKEKEALVLEDLWHIYREIGVEQQAQVCLQQWQEVVQEMDSRPAPKMLMAIAGAYLQSGKTHVALDLFEQSHGIAKGMGYRDEEGTALLNLGKCYQLQQNMLRAKESYEKALEISQEVGNRLVEHEALLNLGNVLEELGDMRKAIACYEQCLIIRKELDKDNAFYTLASIENYQVIFGGAYVKLSDQLFEKAKQLIGQNQLFEAHHRILEANECAESAIQILTEAGRIELIPRLQKSLGVLQQLSNSLEARLGIGEALHTPRDTGQELNIAGGQKDRSEEKRILFALGTKCQEEGDVQQAIKYFEQCLTIEQELNDLISQHDTRIALGIAHDSFARQLIAYIGDSLKKIKELFALSKRTEAQSELVYTRHRLSCANQHAKSAEQYFLQAEYAPGLQVVKELDVHIQKFENLLDRVKQILED